MSKKKLLIFLIIIALTSSGLLYYYEKGATEYERYSPPSVVSSYPQHGLIKFDPQTILSDIIDPEKNIYIPITGDLDTTNGRPVHWSQNDFMEVASSFGRYKWNDPMNYPDWKIYIFFLQGSCEEPMGFYDVGITYYKQNGLEYITRRIEIHLYYGYIEWADGGSYSRPLFHAWSAADITNKGVSADDSLSMISDDLTFQIPKSSVCGVDMVIQPSNDASYWLATVYLDISQYLYSIDRVTGELRKNKGWQK